MECWFEYRAEEDLPNSLTIEEDEDAE